MVSEKFRHQLRQEANQWRSEGHIDPQFYDYLADRYQFNELESSARNRFVLILLGLGSILLGLAVITFVAANWQVWTREFKIILLLTIFIAVNTTGFYFWRYPRQQWQSRIGQGLLLLGSLLLGANIALMSQMFHQSGPIYQLYLVWGFGVLAMAYSLRLTLLGMLTGILWAIALWTYHLDYFTLADDSLWTLAADHLPLIATISLIPLAHYCQSRWLFGLSTTLITASLVSNSLVLTQTFLQANYWSAAIIAGVVTIIPPAVLWSYPGIQRQFGTIAQNIAIVGLSVFFYAASFNFLWRNYTPSLTELVPWEHSTLLLDLIVFTGVAIYGWWKFGYINSSTWRIDLTSTVMAGMILISGLTIWWNLQQFPLLIFAPFIFNVLLLLLAVGLLREAINTGERRGFWFGMTLLVLQVFSRTMEYNTELLTKAILLFLCGVGVIIAGLWFERNVKTISN
ncbi:DUF2157 domain-containing protein [Spirulina sp. CS-785/01]|uniref:DUF2157 domain-containing protein n=1 Tax=Spirulina sp. CS-785/01 TaxID=3021716 RepID=UPI00232C3B4B|nr:DUF2157 domain-containing protein [Spirulina sp. CS-785/01]MDB9312405.1 DUF2157 domain-containing protein [Spirulina sp. CS-785/01]